MSLILDDYDCPEGHRFEYLADPQEREKGEVTCPEHGCPATRVIAAKLISYEARGWADY